MTTLPGSITIRADFIQGGTMAFEALKERHAAMWGAGPFEEIAGTLAEMHDAIIGAVAGRPGDAWLDVGCGTGELALRAAATGASITGCDLSPVLIETARRQAEERGLDIEFEVADCENLLYDDASFDIVTSSVGAIFAPDHERAVSELARVCKPGGRLAISAWTTEGRIGDFFRVIASYSPPPVEGAGVPTQWGDAAYCESLLGNHFELEIKPLNTPWEGESGQEMWDEFSRAFGPIVTLLQMLEPDRAAGLRNDLIALFDDNTSGGGGVVLDRPYLLVKGTRR
jgi:2-polyprenyl-6-hydroxyphenyl methylase/3-demethylubiquinone-9 3-methyltransferase